MQNKLSALYTSIKGRNILSSLFRLIIRLISNIYIPAFYVITKKNQHSIPCIDMNDKKIIVSLTSFPARINRVWIVVESMLRQTVKADLIIMYLAESQFPNRENDIPKKLLKYVNNKQLEIVFVEDLRSHKKYFYSFQKYRNELVLIVDDDIFYPTTILENLLKEYKKYPHGIICTRAYKVQKNKGSISPYKDWKLQKSYCGPNSNLFHTSGGGTLYSPSLFVNDIYDKDVFLEQCNYADDVWLNIQAQRSNILTIKTPQYIEILPIMNRSNIALKKYNVKDNGNDKQLQNLINFYNLAEDCLFVKNNKTKY